MYVTKIMRRNGNWTENNSTHLYILRFADNLVVVAQEKEEFGFITTFCLRHWQNGARQPQQD